MKSDVKFGLFVIFAIGTALGFLVVGLLTSKNQKESPKEARHEAPETELETLDHEGHKFVRKRIYHNGFFLHHPGCPCITKEVERP